MAQEIERKWRLPNLPTSLEHWESYRTRIEQWYIVSDDRGEVRLRKEDGHLTLTFKGSGTILRTEEEYKLESPLGFELLWSKKVGDIIVKDRYSVPNLSSASEPGLTFEIDLYLGALARLMILEIEFPDLASAKSFVLPDWAVGAIDVTYDKRYKNKNLALYQKQTVQELGL